MKPDWTDKETFATEISRDFGKITGIDIENRNKTKTILSPDQWETAFYLYKGFGLSFGHHLRQMIWFPSKKRDEQYNILPKGIFKQTGN